MPTYQPFRPVFQAQRLPGLDLGGRWSSRREVLWNLENLFGGSRRKIAKKIAKNKRCYANILLPPLKDAVEGDEGGLGGHYPLGNLRGWINLSVISFAPGYFVSVLSQVLDRQGAKKMP
jgi:hypothetical protein